MTKAEQNAVLESAVGSPEAAQAWRIALSAMHAFAQVSRCPPGGDVFKWFEERTDDYRRRIGSMAIGLPAQPPEGKAP